MQFLLPILRIAPMQANVSDSRGQESSRRCGFGERRLIDVAEPDLVIDESADGFLACPASVAHLRDEWKLVKSPPEQDQEIAIFLRVSETPRELHEQTSELAGAQ